jgi:hypothetical protein
MAVLHKNLPIELQDVALISYSRIVVGEDEAIQGITGTVYDVGKKHDRTVISLKNDWKRIFVFE